jgi:hypothetical protein
MTDWHWLVYLSPRDKHCYLSTNSYTPCLNIRIIQTWSSVQRWNKLIWKIVILNFVHRLNYKVIKLQRFESCILLSSSGKKGGRDQKTNLLGPLVELASDLVQTILRNFQTSTKRWNIPQEAGDAQVILRPFLTLAYDWRVLSSSCTCHFYYL